MTNFHEIIACYDVPVGGSSIKCRRLLEPKSFELGRSTMKVKNTDYYEKLLMLTILQKDTLYAKLPYLMENQNLLFERNLALQNQHFSHVKDAKKNLL
jgi:hypothetical protein